MNRTMIAFGLAGLLGAATAQAGVSSPAPGTVTLETRQLGNGKATFEVFHNAPYALTGGMGESHGHTIASGEWKRETRWVGRNVVDSYSR
jgi:hypothetical protein